MTRILCTMKKSKRQVVQERVEEDDTPDVSPVDSNSEDGDDGSSVYDSDIPESTGDENGDEAKYSEDESEEDSSAEGSDDESDEGETDDEETDSGSE